MVEVEAEHRHLKVLLLHGHHQELKLYRASRSHHRFPPMDFLSAVKGWGNAKLIKYSN